MDHISLTINGAEYVAVPAAEYKRLHVSEARWRGLGPRRARAHAAPRARDGGVQ